MRIHERTLPIIYPSTSSVAHQNPTTGTHVSGVTSKVSDYGRGVRQRNEAEERFPEFKDSNLLTGLENPAGSKSLQRPDAIRDEDLRDLPKLPIKTLLNRALQLDMRNNEKRFISSGDLKAICNHSAVRDELIEQGYKVHDAESYAKYVCIEPAREIFAVLVLINYVIFLPNFIRAGIIDDNLPFSGNKQQTELWYRALGEQKRVEFLDYSRDPEVIREFYNKQWWVHVPFLDWDKEKRKALNFQFDNGTVIPWTEIGSEDTSGGFGVVEQVKIHKDHHSFTQYESFALKTITTIFDDDYKSFQQEIAAFRKMSPGPHLVELCATIEITPRKNFMLLFPWAEGGSLQNLMSKPRADLLKSFGLTEDEFVKWITAQSRGLVEALGTIHDTRVKHTHIRDDGDQVNQDKDYGIHGDIKPANILHFSQERTSYRLGNLKIADFGLMTFHTRASRTKMDRRTAYAASQTYRSPEHDIGSVMSKKVDTWALGCVFSQLMTWVILDSAACSSYEKARKDEDSYSGAVKKGKWNEDNFFLKHIQKQKQAGGSGTPPVVQRVRPGGLPQHENGVKRSNFRITTTIEDSEEVAKDFEEVLIPKLKVSVTKVSHLSSISF
ncbi:kinase-like domain-containing protein [Fusarium acuminatum]|uniref:Kinase-like domain-containing protein n=1 Tax=Fusarium acuminatum TaxID=5515 RepID=A0ABZ2WLD6_9HYPO